MSGRPGRNAEWERWADNRKPVENTPRREEQIREWERQQRRTA
jgi:hypothetical protein